MPTPTHQPCLLKGLRLLGRARGHSIRFVCCPFLVNRTESCSFTRERQVIRLVYSCKDVLWCFNVSSANRFDRWPNNDTCTIDDICTTSDTDSDVGGCKIDLTSRAGDVFWLAEGLSQHTSDLKMDLHLDTIATPRTAFFLLRGHCALKDGTPVSIPLYLFIYPENIQSVEFA